MSNSFSPLLSFLRPQYVFYLHLLLRIAFLCHESQAFLLQLALQFVTTSVLIWGIAKSFLYSAVPILHSQQIWQKDYSVTQLQLLFLPGFQKGLNVINLAQCSNS